MAIVSDFTGDWSATVTLSGNEFWQVRRGPVYIATAATVAPTDSGDGVLLNDGDILTLNTGEVVRYRSARADGTGVVVRRSRS